MALCGKRAHDIRSDFLRLAEKENTLRLWTVSPSFRSFFPVML